MHGIDAVLHGAVSVSARWKIYQSESVVSRAGGVLLCSQPPQSHLSGIAVPAGSHLGEVFVSRRGIRMSSAARTASRSTGCRLVASVIQVLIGALIIYDHFNDNHA